MSSQQVFKRPFRDCIQCHLILSLEIGHDKKPYSRLYTNKPYAHCGYATDLSRCYRSTINCGSKSGFKLYSIIHGDGNRMDSTTVLCHPAKHAYLIGCRIGYMNCCVTMVFKCTYSMGHHKKCHPGSSVVNSITNTSSTADENTLSVNLYLPHQVGYRHQCFV